ncbi:MAG: MaoC family dehydratase [Parvibaculales bacterium]
MGDGHMMEGRYFEHFTLGDIIEHGVPRSLSEGDASLYQALYGARNPLFCARPVAEAIGLNNMPLDSWLVFHIVFGKTVADISRHAVANLGYAQGLFHAPVFVGDTLTARSEVIGLRQNKSGESGLVMVRTSGMNQHGETVLSYVRWVMVKKRDTNLPAPETVWPDMAAPVAPAQVPPPQGDFSHWQADYTGSEAFFDDYQTGMKISHGDGTTLEEAEHMLATRLYQNNAAVHFDAHMQSQSRFGKRLIYGGHMMSHVASMAFNGLGNLAGYAALNGGSHAAPCFAGDTIYGWSEIVDKTAFDRRDDVGALRLRHIVLKNRLQQAENGDFIDKKENGDLAEEVVLELDVWAYMPRRL